MPVFKLFYKVSLLELEKDVNEWLVKNYDTIFDEFVSQELLIDDDGGYIISLLIIKKLNNE